MVVDNVPVWDFDPEEMDNVGYNWGFLSYLKQAFIEVFIEVNLEPSDHDKQLQPGSQHIQKSLLPS